MKLLTHSDVKELNQFLSEVMETRFQYVCNNHEEIMATYNLVIKDKYIDYSGHCLVPYTKAFEEQVRKWCKDNANVIDLGYLNSIQKIMVYNEDYYKKNIMQFNK